MPILPVPAYHPVLPLTNGHMHTIYPTLFRTVPPTFPRRERLETPDGDFLDIDWHECPENHADTLVVISHGLEGNARKKYPLGMARQMNRIGFDAICLNFRGCSGQPNRLPRLYHSGVTDDLHTVILHGIHNGYRRIFLVGFSMGGNQTLKYLGENPGIIPPEVQGAAVFSVPCDLAGSAEVMDRPVNCLYMKYFMKGLRHKVQIKATMFPELFDTEGLEGIRTFQIFDDRYTAPIHGFLDAADYYAQSSCKPFMSSICVPSLVVQAKDDPFLSPSCYPWREAEASPNVFLEIPMYGGHVGFHLRGRENVYWSEQRAGDFFLSLRT
ncbi:MAG: alpha/beta fold hydrolase [Desulfoplanes sp.]|nr:alpha/beta fold hydrolase [Desulfoplanes sp.]MDD4648487.1 alpha/beta fold hydrolase [Desulfoplanes sp.]